MESVSRECLERIARIYANNPAARRAAGPVVQALGELRRRLSLEPCRSGLEAAHHTADQVT